MYKILYSKIMKYQFLPLIVRVINVCYISNHIFATINAAIRLVWQALNVKVLAPGEYKIHTTYLNEALIGLLYFVTGCFIP